MLACLFVAGDSVKAKHAAANATGCASGIDDVGRVIWLRTRARARAEGAVVIAVAAAAAAAAATTGALLRERRGVGLNAKNVALVPGRHLRQRTALRRMQGSHVEQVFLLALGDVDSDGSLAEATAADVAKFVHRHNAQKRTRATEGRRGESREKQALGGAGEGAQASGRWRELGTWVSD